MLTLKSQKYNEVLACMCTVASSCGNLAAASVVLSCHPCRWEQHVYCLDITIQQRKHSDCALSEDLTLSFCCNLKKQNSFLNPYLFLPSSFCLAKSSLSLAKAQRFQTLPRLSSIPALWYLCTLQQLHVFI